MKHHRYTHIHHLVSLAALASLLAARGNSAPSESDAKQAVQIQLGDCKYVEMSDLDRVNGTQNSDDHPTRPCIPT